MRPVAHPSRRGEDAAPEDEDLRSGFMPDSQLQRHRNRHMVGRPMPASRIAQDAENRSPYPSARARPRCGRAGGRDRRSSSPPRGNSTGVDLFRNGMRSRATSNHSPWVWAASSFSHSIGVCDTILSNCLCDHTSFSYGATLRSPTRICRSSPARMQRLAGFHLVEELQLVLEFRIERGVGNIAARRHVEIMQHQRF